jgi:tetratricopeptide (TPR) repeat protein
MRLAKRLFLVAALCLAPACARGLETNDATKKWDACRLAGNKYLKAGDYPAAAQSFRRALELAEPSVGVSAQDLAGLYSSLASAYTQQGHFAQAGSEFQRALALVEKTKGRNSLEYAVIFANMALLPTDGGSKTEVMRVLDEAIRVNAETAGQRDLAVAQDYLVKLLVGESRYTEAERILVNIQSSAYLHSRTVDPEVKAELLNDFGVLRTYQGRYQQALDWELQSFEVLKTSLGANHSALVVPLSNLATSYAQMGRYDDAERKYEEAIALCAKTFGEEHPTYGATLANYAVLLKRLGRKRESKKMEARAQQILEASDRYNGIGLTVSVADLRGGMK